MGKQRDPADLAQARFGRHRYRCSVHLFPVRDWNAPRREWFADLHEHMAKSMFYGETHIEEFPDEEKRNLWRNRAHWAMIAMGEAIPRYAGHLDSVNS